MDSFSERYGYTEKKPIQVDSMDDDLRTGLWNVLHASFWIDIRRTVSGTVNGAVRRAVPNDNLQKAIIQLWVNFFNLPLDHKPLRWSETIGKIRAFYYGADWCRIYDLMEFMAPLAKSKSEFIKYCNNVLDRERSAWRFVGDKIAPITNEIEIGAIEVALSTPYDAVRTQIKNALALLSNKPVPDFRNCIKESIGAVETAARLAAGQEKGTLGQLLSDLQKKLDLHSSQVEGFKKLYAYTSDDNSGIRHGMMDKDNLTADDARYMLVSCSAFANYLLRLAERAGTIPSK